MPLCNVHTRDGPNPEAKDSNPNPEAKDSNPNPNHFILLESESKSTQVSNRFES